MPDSPTKKNDSDPSITMPTTDTMRKKAEMFSKCFLLFLKCLRLFKCTKPSKKEHSPNKP